MINADSLALRNLTCDELTYGHSNGSIEDQESFIHSLVSGKTDVLTLDIKDQDITLKGDVAWVRYNMISTMMSNGTTSNLNIKVLLVWTKVHGVWKLLARQAVK
jgi:ketosteroid isomerase-like protein